VLIPSFFFTAGLPVLEEKIKNFCLFKFKLPESSFSHPDGGADSSSSFYCLLFAAEAGEVGAAEVTGAAGAERNLLS
jgi:hypothetical protein